MEGQLTVEESERLARVQEACLAGLNLPAYRPLDSEELRERYEFFLKAATCLERHVGWTIEEAPSFEVWIETVALRSATSGFVAGIGDP